MCRQLLKVSLGKITKKEVTKAIKALKNNKAAGINQFFAELLKYGGEEIVTWLTYLFNRIWEKEVVPDNWTKGVVVKLPKKGNLANCNNWRGITLLYVPGKAFSSILIQRLQDDLDASLREEKAGFRPKRPCCVIVTGVRHGCILSSLLFLLIVDFVQQQSMNEPHFGRPWKD